MPVSRRDHRTLEAHPQLRLPGPDGSVEYGKSVEGVGTERQRLDPDDRAKVKIAVKVWKQRAAARGFPFQPVAEPRGIDSHQKKTALAGKVLFGGLDDLRGCRKVDEAVPAVGRRAAKYACAFGRAP